MTTLMRIINGELHAKGFRDIEVGLENNMINLDRIMLEDLGDTVDSFFYAVFGLETTMVEPSHVYLSEQGILFAPSFVQNGEDVSITDKQAIAKAFVEKDIID